MSRPAALRFQRAHAHLLEARLDEPRRFHREFRGRLIESAVGAHLANAAALGSCELFDWRERNFEVDFVLRAGKSVVAIEVKSGRAPEALPSRRVDDWLGA